MENGLDKTESIWQIAASTCAFILSIVAMILHKKSGWMVSRAAADAIVSVHLFTVGVFNAMPPFSTSSIWVCRFTNIAVDFVYEWSTCMVVLVFVAGGHKNLVWKPCVLLLMFLALVDIPKNIALVSNQKYIRLESGQCQYGWRPSDFLLDSYCFLLKPLLIHIVPAFLAILFIQKRDGYNRYVWGTICAMRALEYILRMSLNAQLIYARDIYINHTTDFWIDRIVYGLFAARNLPILVDFFWRRK